MDQEEFAGKVKDIQENVAIEEDGIIRAGDVGRTKQSARATRTCRARGWDPIYGEIWLGIDVEGKKPACRKYADYKAWWPFTEAMPATASD